MRISRHSITATILAVAVVLSVSLSPVLRAGRAESRQLSLPEQIYASAAEGERALAARPFDQRDPAAYPRVIDLYRQVTEIAASTALADRARMHMADLTREMALRTGDASEFERAIDTYRRLVTSRPDSPYVGEALVAIAQIYQYDLQDLDGAAAAYRDVARRFPGSVSGREAEANIARLDMTAGDGAAESSVIGAIAAPGADVAAVLGGDGEPSARVVNLRSFAGPNYARVVVDLNRASEYAERREGTRVTYTLPNVQLSDALLGRRLATPRDSILRGMRVEQFGDGVRITLDLATLDDTSVFALDDPARLIIDLRGAGARALPAPKGTLTNAAVASTDDLGRLVPNLALADAGALPAPPPVAPAPDVVAPSAPAPDVVASAASAPRDLRCVVIDPGHGGQDTGTIGPGGLAEKDVVLDIARRLRASLSAELPGVQILLTRDSDRFISLEERTAVANAHDADLFVSIHANASQSSAASGIETFVPDPDALQKEQQKRRPDEVFASVTFASQVSASRSLAGFVQGSLVRGVSAKSPNSARDRGIKHASFAVLRGARMPAILAEVSFVSNPDDENRLRTPAFRQRIASSLTAGIRGYVRSLGRPS